MRQPLSRFSVSIPSSLLAELDRMLHQKGYRNRSLGIAAIGRDALVEHRQSAGTSPIAGTITLLYDHHRSHVQEKLTQIQHHHLHQIVSALHVHLDHDNCLEVLVVRGKAAEVKKLADALIAARGVKHGKLTVTSLGSDLPA